MYCEPWALIQVRGEQGELWTKGGKCGIDAERLKGLAQQLPRSTATAKLEPAKSGGARGSTEPDRQRLIDNAHNQHPQFCISRHMFEDRKAPFKRPPRRVLETALSQEARRKRVRLLMLEQVP